jgi:hypothetical protein
MAATNRSTKLKKSKQRRKDARPSFPRFPEWQEQERKKAASLAAPVSLRDIPKMDISRLREQELEQQLEAYANAKAAHEYRRDVVWRQINREKLRGPRNACTKLMEICFNDLKAQGRVPRGRRELLDSVRAHDPKKDIVTYIPGEGDEWKDNLGKVEFEEPGGTKGSMTLESISQWLFDIKRTR